MKLNLGCGGLRLPGYVGLDALPNGAADVLGTADRLPFRDGAFDAVYASHVLEHLEGNSLDRAVREVHRVLRPGGMFRVRVPYGLKSLFMAHHHHAFDETTFMAWLDRGGQDASPECLQAAPLFRRVEQRVVGGRGATGFPAWHLRHYVPRISRSLFVSADPDGQLSLRFRVPWVLPELQVTLVKV